MYQKNRPTSQCIAKAGYVRDISDQAEITHKVNYQISSQHIMVFAVSQLFDLQRSLKVTESNIGKQIVAFPEELQ